MFDPIKIDYRNQNHESKACLADLLHKYVFSPNGRLRGGSKDSIFDPSRVSSFRFSAK
ncbi:hypothetical protein ACRALDRAFT_212788 [Sodiomyces alcalophilus JCM 7366]|uniref:uncharacterized protein n=1 Tax=Sodiomyces alcalophilus JCM 7366 TaxID=591952 RepID=UPI0039B5A3B8